VIQMLSAIEGGLVERLGFRRRTFPTTSPLLVTKAVTVLLRSW
jgi:hypothetical protein